MENWDLFYDTATTYELKDPEEKQKHGVSEKPEEREPRGENSFQK